jgi:hypothetical protein
MSVLRDYHIDPEIKFQPLEVIDVSAVIASCREQWQNKTLCRVNNLVVRLGVIHGEFLSAASRRGSFPAQGRPR